MYRLGATLHSARRVTRIGDQPGGGLLSFVDERQQRENKTPEREQDNQRLESIHRHHLLSEGACPLLSERLKDLEYEGIVKREVYPEINLGQPERTIPPAIRVKDFHPEELRNRLHRLRSVKGGMRLFPSIVPLAECMLVFRMEERHDR